MRNDHGSNVIYAVLITGTGHGIRSVRIRESLPVNHPLVNLRTNKLAPLCTSLTLLLFYMLGFIGID